MPGISPERWNDLLNNDYHPLRDKTIQDHYSPGSTFKTITAIAALEEGVIDENFTVNCSGVLPFGNHPFHCWRKHGHGTMNVVQALTQSCDIFFYKVSQKLGIDNIAKYAMMLGLGRKTGINLAHEAAGLIPTEEWKRSRYGQEWSPGGTLSCAIGDSYVVTTPLQLANAYAAIATGGVLWKPYLVKYIESPDGHILKEFQSEPLGKVTISQKTLALVHKGLYQVVNDPHGTSYGAHIPGIDVAGKTGSTQVIGLSAVKLRSTKCENMPFNLRDNGLFAAFAPPDDPSIAVAVITEHSCHGATRAAPVALAVIKAYLQKYIPDKYSDAAIKLARKEKAATRKTAPAAEVPPEGAIGD